MATQELANKTIFMTYKKEVPNFVFDRWKKYNKDYEIDFSLDDDCKKFLKEHFNDYICNLFETIPRGDYKADLWRLCKLYVHGGVYADVDLVPYIDIDSLDKDVSFYSCLTKTQCGVFQAFIVCPRARNPLILHFLISLLINKAYMYLLDTEFGRGPTFDMYQCIQNSLNNIIVLPEKKYELDKVKIFVNVGPNPYNTVKYVDLFYFPNDVEYTVELLENPYTDSFTFFIKNNMLIVTRVDIYSGWEYNHSVNICIKSKEKVFLFTEIEYPLGNYLVLYNKNKILDSRDKQYVVNKGW